MWRAGPWHVGKLTVEHGRHPLELFGHRAASGWAMSVRTAAATISALARGSAPAGCA